MAKGFSTSRGRATDPNALGRRFKRNIKQGHVQLGGIAAEYLRPSLVKLYRHAGFDFIFVESEHLAYNPRELADFVLAARDNSLPVIAKIGDLTQHEVIRLMDCGVIGIQLPRTETREQVEQLLDWMRFPPKGSRPGAPVWGNVDYAWPQDSRQWLKQSNNATMMVAHIETKLGYDNIDDILTTPGLDMLYVGPYDFSIALNEPGDYEHPTIRRAMLDICDRCIQHGVAFGTTASCPEKAAELVKRGCRFFEVMDELSMIASTAIQLVDDYRRTLHE